MLERLRVAVLPLLMAGPAAAQDAPNPSFYLVNRSATAISRVFASPDDAPNWGADRLGGRPIAPGRNAAIRLPADGRCVYDLRIVYAGGQVEEQRGVDTCRIDNIGFPGGRSMTADRSQRSAADPSFLLVNRGRAALNELYLSLPDDESWGEDRLGDDTLPAGASRAVRLPRGACIYDLRVVFANGEANEKRRLNLCDITDLRVP